MSLTDVSCIIQTQILNKKIDLTYGNIDLHGLWGQKFHCDWILIMNA
uniref:Uncharacterized protein n=1 Tax=Anguilla anguilla TaxID=7936 RepID=A0A0E9SR40_ANGAN